MQENTPAAAECHMRGCARVLFTCESVRYGCDDQPLELRLDSGFQVLHLQYHLLRLWKRDVTTTADSGYGRGSDVTVVIDRCCNKLVNEDSAHEVCVKPRRQMKTLMIQRLFQESSICSLFGDRAR